jgi:hypothetical protein
MMWQLRRRREPRPDGLQSRPMLWGFVEFNTLRASEVKKYE